MEMVAGLLNPRHSSNSVKSMPMIETPTNHIVPHFTVVWMCFCALCGGSQGLIRLLCPVHFELTGRMEWGITPPPKM